MAARLPVRCAVSDRLLCLRRISHALLHLADVSEVGPAARRRPFAGLANIQRVFTDELALKALVNSAIYTLFAVPFQLVISFSLALALTQPLKLRSMYRAGLLPAHHHPRRRDRRRLAARAAPGFRHPEHRARLGGHPRAAVAAQARARQAGLHLYVVLDDRPPDGDLHRRARQHPGPAAGSRADRRREQAAGRFSRSPSR